MGPMSQKLEIRALGNLSIDLDGKPVAGLPSRAAQALLVYLVSHDRAISRERLAELLWADRTQEQALTNLRTILTPLKKKLGGYLLISRGSLAFNHETEYWVDAAEIEHRLDRLESPRTPSGILTSETTDRLKRALALYQGDFLEGFYLREGPGFEEWALVVRERLRRLVSDGLRLLTAHHLATGSYGEGIETAEQLLKIEPFDEEGWRMKMWLQLRGGRRNAAIKAYEALRNLLQEELGVEPTDATRAMYDRIRTLTFPPPLRLPPSPTAFVGRQQEIGRVVRELMASDARLLTLFGPGGIGKTRLAVEAANRLYADRPGLFLNGIYFVPLAGVRDPEILAGSVASALGLTLQGARSPEEQLIQYLGDREVMLVLDNFEQLLPLHDEDSDGRQFLERLLEKTKGIKFLVTSRSRLNLYEEVVLEVTGLAVPEGRIGKPGQFDAIDLFIQAARQKQPAFGASDEEMHDIARICQHLQGVPLAIELAAHWVRILSCSQINAEIARGLEILRSTQHNLPARHRSMRAVFDHSWVLLDPDHQRMYSGLSVFSGGFDLGSARAVVGAKAADLLALADRSLVQKISPDRFEIHELLRQFAAEKLAEDKRRAVEVLAAHAEYFLSFLQRLDPASAPEQAAPTWETSAAELNNIRLAWKTVLDLNDLEGMARGLPGLAQHFLLHGPLDEGKDLIQATLDQLNGDQARGSQAAGLAANIRAHLARFGIAKGQYQSAMEWAQASVQEDRAADGQETEALAHLCWGEAHWHQGEYAEAQLRIEQALEAARRADSRYLEAESLRLLGQTYWPLGDYREAEQYYHQALEIYRQTGNLHGESMALTYLGILFFEQDAFAEARNFMEQAAVMNQAAGDKLGEGRVLTNLCVVCCFQGDYGAAVVHNERALRLLDEVGETTGYIANIRNQGMIKVYLGQYAEAEIAQLRALELFRSIGDRRGECYALTGLCNLFNQWGNHPRALLYGEKALELARELSIDYSIVKALTFWGTALAASGRLDEAALAFQEAYDQGRLSNQPMLALEPLAGLARIVLEKGDLRKALSHVEPILAQLQTRQPEGASEPLRIYLTCYQVLNPLNDPRAQLILDTAHRLLQRQAASIKDADLRASFIEAVQANRELLTTYRRQTAPSELEQRPADGRTHES